MIHISEYKEAWPHQFEKLKEKLWHPISKFAISMEHVGSTSVPNLCAKPIIDVDIVVIDIERMKAITHILCQNGYQHMGNLGIPGREMFRCNKPEFPHHLYVCLQDSPAFQNHILFRNHLRSHPDDCQKYAQLKKNLAKKFPEDMKSYVEGKTSFVLSILDKYDISRKDLSEIEISNKS